MKKIRILLALSIATNVLIAQSDTTKNTKYDLNIDLGLKFTPFDYLGGAILGLSIYSPDKKFAVNFRNDILLSIGKSSSLNSVGNIIPSEKFSVLEYHTLNYFELDYKISNFNKKPLYIGLGSGWVYLGEGKNIRFNSETGYATITSSLKYKISWFAIEVRGDYALKGRSFKGYNITKSIFPISFGLIYKFKPSK